MNLRNYKTGDIFLDTNGYLWYWDKGINDTVVNDNMNMFTLRLIPHLDSINMSLTVVFKLPFPEIAEKETTAGRWGWLLNFDHRGQPFESGVHINHLTAHLTKEEYPEYFL